MHVGLTQAPIRLGVVRVFLYCLLEDADGLLERVPRIPPQVVKALQVEVVRLQIVGPPPEDAQALLGHEAWRLAGRYSVGSRSVG